MIDEIEVTDFQEAALFQYLGYPCLRCTASATDARWLFRCKRFDVEIVKEEFQSPETSVLLRGFIKALNAVASFRNAARRSLDRQWRSERYARA